MDETRKRKTSSASKAESTPVDSAPPKPVPVVYYRKKKKSTTPVKGAPPKRLKAYTRKRTKPIPGTSVIVWDLQLHTSSLDVLRALELTGKPVRVRFIHRKDYITRYTWCCLLIMESVEDATRVLEKDFYTIKNVKVKVTREEGSEGSEVVQGRYKLEVWNMNRLFTRAFTLLRILFIDCSCAEIRIVKGSRRGHARLRFRTEEGRTKATAILNDLIATDKDYREWTYAENDEAASDDEE